MLIRTAVAAQQWVETGPSEKVMGIFLTAANKSVYLPVDSYIHDDRHVLILIAIYVSTWCFTVLTMLEGLGLNCVNHSHFFCHWFGIWRSKHVSESPLREVFVCPGRH